MSYFHKCPQQAIPAKHTQWIQTSPLFPHFVTLQPYSKIDFKTFFLITLHTIPSNDKAKTACNLYANVWGKKTK
jgi:hypothetical protein